MESGVEACHCEGMRRVGLFCLCRYNNLVIVGVMCDV